MINADGTSVRQITRNADDSDVPAWSPDSRQIAFNIFNNNSDFQIFIVNADGSKQHPVTGPREDALKPAWSPDGRKIAFSGDAGISVIDTDGSHRRLLAARGNDPSLRGDDPAWSPDGRRIAFDSDQSGRSEIYVMNADGTHQHALTHK